jgi:hypothetical protein
LRSWTGGVLEHFIRITPELLTGRRLAAPGAGLAADGLRPAEAV